MGLDSDVPRESGAMLSSQPTSTGMALLPDPRGGGAGGADTRGLTPVLFMEPEPLSFRSL